MKEVADGCMQQLYAELVRSTIAAYPRALDGDESHREKEDLIRRLEAMGYDAGYRFVERTSMDRPRMMEPLDVIKFLCKDFWVALFKKQIDKLQTNHRGVFVVQDLHFRWLANLSAGSDDRTKELALLFLVFPCGVIRGALANLGISADVNADVGPLGLPACLFNIKMNT